MCAGFHPVIMMEKALEQTQIQTLSLQKVCTALYSNYDYARKGETVCLKNFCFSRKIQ